MPAPVKHDIGIVVFDVRSSHLLEDFLKFVSWQQLNTKDQHLLMLANVKQCKNSKRLPNLLMFPNNLAKMKLKEVKDCIEDALVADEENTLNLGHIFRLAFHHLKTDFQDPIVVTKQIIIFSELLSGEPVEEGLLQMITDRILKEEIYLYIVGPRVNFLMPVKGPDYFCEDTYKDNIGLMVPTPIQEQMKTLVCNVSGVMAEVDVGLHLLLTYRRTGGSQPWKVPLTIGTKIQIPVKTSKVYRTDVNIQVKKEMIGEREPDSFALAEDITIPVDHEDIVRGLSICNNFVAIENDSTFFKSNTEPTFDIICFTPSENVPIAFMSGQESFVVLAEKNEKEPFFNALVTCLASQKKYAIASRVYIRQTQPKYFALIPLDDVTPKR
ncbi:unnamed protein product [Acanthoscelides obtectus]|nr:unnamed protein product [Acanthoscelides obtectus]CAK1628500.1 hypothetical protein AOBTE_LOCUS5248 [Acanthoscelides obtectus]